LAVDPSDPERIVAATERGLGLSEDDGESWRPLARELGLLVWPDAQRLFLIDGAGDVRVSEDRGENWRRLGSIGGQPAAFATTDGGELYGALIDGTIMSSSDGGESWDVRSSQ
jgi:photosystem II stability/assembly factor-like uncharacterized protein